MRASRSFAAAAALLLAVAVPGDAAAAETAVPRVVLGLYDSWEGERPHSSRISLLAELPLNHLGLVVAYQDIRAGLPDLSRLEGVRGILSFPATDKDMPGEVLDWAAQAIDRGLRVVLLGDIPLPVAGSSSAPDRRGQRLLRQLGLQAEDRFVGVTYRSRIAQADPAVVGFERMLAGALPAYPVLRTINPEVTSHLTLRPDADRPGRADLVVTGPHGGVAVSGYELRYDEGRELYQWVINPFEFFRRAFGTDDLPKPDTTTLSGRRIYYSHIDGDGWANVTELPAYRRQEVTAAEVILEKAIAPYPDLPVTVAPIAAELQPDRRGGNRSAEVARRIFALPQVEAGSHTFTHPFDWGFFEHYTPEKEARYREPSPQHGGLASWLPWRAEAGMADHNHQSGSEYTIPRAYLDRPFDLGTEIIGAVEAIDRLAAPKRVRLIQWSGDTQPFERALAMVREAGLVAINGGDTRLDAEFPSYTTVAALTRTVGQERQIYASASNEYTYTKLWSGNFAGFAELRQTVKRTETPYRVKPFNIYYHMYSGEKAASLAALIANLDLARQQELAPIPASEFAAIVGDFHRTRLVAEGDRSWRVLDRGSLQTIRFDHATRSAVDLSRSLGVLGQRHHQGSLYVALDPAAARPLIVLRSTTPGETVPVEPQPYLVSARWQVRALDIGLHGWRFEAAGFGSGEMAWQVPAQESTYTVTAFDHERPVWRGLATSDENGELRFAIAADGVRPLMVLVRPRFGPEGDLLAGALPERLASREMLADAGPEPAAGHDLVVCLAPDDERSRPAGGVVAPGELPSPAKPSCTVLPQVGSDG